MTFAETNPFQDLGIRYETGNNPSFYRGIAARLLEWAFQGDASSACRPTENGPILDLGCGSGISTRLLAEAFPKRRVIGVDPSNAMLTVARKRDGKSSITWIQGRAEELPFPAGSFPLVFCSMAGHWFTPGTGSEICRVMLRGGRLAMAVTMRKPDLLLPGNRALARMAKTAARKGIARSDADRFSRRRGRGLNSQELSREYPQARIRYHSFSEEFTDATHLADSLETRGVLAAYLDGQRGGADLLMEYIPPINRPDPIAYRWKIALLVMDA